MKHTMSTHITVIVCITVLLLFAGCTSPETTKPQPPVGVEVQAVKLVNYQMQLSYSGTIEESVSISLSFPIPGKIERVLVRQGEQVRKGQLLATLNGESFKNSYELSLAKQKQAEDALKRFEPMFKNSTMPEIKLVELQTGLKQSLAATAIAKKNWDDCQLLAPTHGVIGKRTIEPGMNVLPDMPVITLVQIEQVFVRFPVPENEVSQIKKEQRAEIIIPALGTTVLQGNVEEIGVLANMLSRSYDVKIALPNPRGEIRPGMVCNVRLITAETNTMLVVPNQAVQVDEYSDYYVYVANTQQNIAQRRKIKIGPLLETGISVTQGLTADEQVIVAGNQKLTDNTAISILH